ncbi:ABC transporter substrate-binding protein [Xanthobacter aminoxidans]|uniref:ABC transporter substrate-binding protein n=1 Tax=Xanthobacter aminoxidans TaxID=186280 RepID=A0ABW6ZER5_9HYPH
MRRRFQSLLFAAALLPLAGLSSMAASAETLLKIGVAQLSAGGLPVLVADQKGFFAEEGLKYERLDFKGGGPVAQALASGSIDLCICAADHAVHLQDRGLGGKVLVALAEQHSYALIGKADSTARSIADLKGEKIGITTAGSLTDTTVRYAIRKAGFDPDKDFVLLSVGRAGAQKAALQAGAIAGGMFSTPDIQIVMAEKGAYRIIEDFRKLPYPAQDLIATDTWLKAHPEDARKVARAVVKALRLIQQDKTVLFPAIKSLFPEMKDDAMVAQLADDLAAGYLSKDGVMSPESFNFLMAMMTIAEPKLKPMPYADIVALSYLPK